MGYLAEGKENAYFIRMTDDIEKEFRRLYFIGKRTRSKRVKKKIARRMDTLVKVD